jgi:hypothetical protein
MKIFISWSGERSKQLGDYLAFWLKCVIQNTKPWVSTNDIDSGVIWQDEINKELHDTNFGIICLTNDNKEKPWILFEAGAMAKGMSKNRVCPILIDLKKEDVKPPLSQFNLTIPDEDGIQGLLKSINNQLGDKGLDPKVLKETFETNWPNLKSRLDVILKDYPAITEPKSRDEEDILSEILMTTRRMDTRVRRLEKDTRPSILDDYMNSSVLDSNKDFDFNNRSLNLSDEFREKLKDSLDNLSPEGKEKLLDNIAIFQSANRKKKPPNIKL